jgi:hypothetical protein
MEYKQKMRIEHEVKSELDKKYSKIHIFGVGKDFNDIIFVSQSKKDKGMVIASISNEGVADLKVREVKRSEMESIKDFFLYQAEPHDIDNFAKDVFVIDEEA